MSVFLVLFVLSHLFSGTSDGDDTYIYMQYVRRLLTTGDFTFNLHEPSAGVTSMLWPLLMTPICAIFGTDVVVWKLASSISFAAAGVALYACLCALDIPRIRASLLAACLALDVLALRWSGTGMDNGPADCIVVLAIGLMVMMAYDKSPHPVLFGLVLSLMPFVRPELVLLSASITMFAVRCHGLTSSYTVRFVAGGMVAGIIALLAVHLLVGSIVPQTLAAKSISLKQTDPLHAAKALTMIVGAGSGIFALAVLFWIVVTKSLGPRQWLLHVIVPVGLAVLFLAQRNMLVSTRYESYLALPLVVAGIFHIARQIGSVIARAALVLQFALAVGVAVFLWPATRTSDGEDIRRVTAGFSQKVPPGARVALTEVGAFGFYSHWYIIDLVGLVDRRSLAYLEAHGRPRSDDELDEMLFRRGATHYVNMLPKDRNAVVIEHTCLRLTPVASGSVERNILDSGGYTSKSLWVIYEITYRMDSSAPRCAYLRSVRSL